MKGRAPFKPVGFEDNQNLNEVRWNQLVLERLVSEWEEENGRPLRHSEAIVYCNVAQDRFRLVVMYYTIPVLILPPVNPEDRLSIYLKVGEFLRKFNPSNKVLVHIDEEIESVKERIERRARVAKKIKNKRK